MSYNASHILFCYLSCFVGHFTFLSLLNPLNYHHFFGALLFFIFFAPPNTAWGTVSDEFWYFEPLFGSEAWNNAGFHAPLFEEEEEPSTLLCTSHTSPLLELETAPIVSVVESLENVPAQDFFSPERTKRLPDEMVGPSPQAPQKKPRNRPCIDVLAAEETHTKALKVFAKGGKENLKKAYELFLICYRQNTSYRWQGCLGLAHTCLLLHEEEEAFVFFARIEKGKLCPLAVKAQASHIKSAYLKNE